MDTPQKNPEIQPVHTPEIKPGSPEKQPATPHPEIAPNKDPLPATRPTEVPKKEQ